MREGLGSGGYGGLEMGTGGGRGEYGGCCT
jgi:hypothetical protein